MEITFFAIFVVLPPVMFFIIFFGERWRASRLQHNNTGLEKIIDTAEVYRESQNPLWPHILLVAICLATVAGPALSLLSDPKISIYFTLCILGVLSSMVLVIGLFFGFYVEVNTEKLIVRMGVIRIKVLTVSLKDIRSAEVVAFRPLKDFGGWGLRLGKDNTWAYFMSGTQGVKIITNKNRKYIIGSDTPELLCQVVLANASPSSI